ncbi:MAG TPA: hypothetical protein VN253_07605 [Kofleriaceae bacterium]|nr:hypothetical protein [Kofleriaceae bacterium]
MSASYNPARLVLSSGRLVRALLLLVLAISPACVGTIDGASANNDDANGPSLRCAVDEDCIAVGARCCECPTFAVHVNDPVRRACSPVECPPSECAANVTAVCSEEQRCELACKPLACDPGQTCEQGYALDQNGCLTCECAVPVPGGCTLDADCARTRADCCGCQQGGFDTAVLAADRARIDADLMCPAQPACPGVDTCTTDEPTCVQGRCALVAPMPPTGACGRPDLPACPAGAACIVNASDQANMHGVGVCGPPP